jgi:hypothetical protein
VSFLTYFFNITADSLLSLRGFGHYLNGDDGMLQEEAILLSLSRVFTVIGTMKRCYERSVKFL